MSKLYMPGDIIYVYAHTSIGDKPPYLTLVATSVCGRDDNKYRGMPFAKLDDARYTWDTYNKYLKAPPRDQAIYWFHYKGSRLATFVDIMSVSVDRYTPDHLKIISKHLHKYEL